VVCKCFAGKQSDFDSAQKQLKQAQAAADTAKADAEEATTALQEKQETYDQALIAQAAAKAVYDNARQDLSDIQQAAANASAYLVNVSSTTLAVGTRMDQARLAAAEAQQKVNKLVVAACHSQMSVA